MSTSVSCSKDHSERRSVFLLVCTLILALLVMALAVSVGVPFSRISELKIDIASQKNSSSSISMLESNFKWFRESAIEKLEVLRGLLSMEINSLSSDLSALNDTLEYISNLQQKTVEETFQLEHNS